MGLGCCCCCPGGKHTPGYTNTTRVADPAGGADIEPYAKPYLKQGFIGAHCNIQTSDECGGAGLPACGPWPVVRPKRDCAAGGGTVTEFAENCLTASAEVDASSCLHKGQKVVQSYKFHHGRNSFTCPSGCTEEKRYRTVTRHGRASTGLHDSAPPHDVISTKWDVEITDIKTVDRYSGIIVQHDVVITYHIGDSGTYPLNEIDQGLQYLFEDINLFTASVCITDDDVTALNSSYVSTLDGHTYYETFSRTATRWDFDKFKEFSSWGWYRFTGYCTLSEEYTASELYQDGKNLMEYWQLNNEIYLPWRIDGWRGLGVIVRRNENGQTNPDVQVAADTGSTITYTDQNIADFGFDGTVLGAPFTSGRPDKLFGWSHETWKCCKGADDPCIYAFISHYGQFSGSTNYDATDRVIPKTASEWTDNQRAAYACYPGNWVSYGLPNPHDCTGVQKIWLVGCLGMQKTVEAPTLRAGHNFFRPAGADRWAMDTTQTPAKTTCIDPAWDGTNPVLVLSDISAQLSADDLMVFFGDVQGFSGRVFKVDSATATAITLKDFPNGIATVRNVADAFTLWTGDMASGRIGKLRFPVAWPILGRVAIGSAVQNGGNVDVTLAAEAKYLCTGDKVDFIAADITDTNLDNNGAAGYAVTVTDSTHFSFAGTYNATNHTQSVKSHGAPLSKWNTTAARGDFVKQHWAADAATGTFATTPTNSDSNAAYSKCATAGIYGSPNTDHDAGWKDAGFPSSVTPNTCGTAETYVVIQDVIDPLHQPPLACTGGTSYCAPMVEAMLAAKVTSLGVPALPAGCTFESRIPTTAPATLGWDCSSARPYEATVPWVSCA